MSALASTCQAITGTNLPHKSVTSSEDNDRTTPAQFGHTSTQECPVFGFLAVSLKQAVLQNKNPVND
jgi:hypothetical protein